MKPSTLTRKAPIARTGFKPAESKPPKGPRKKTCKVCRAKFSPMSMSHKACSVDCALDLVKQENAARERKEDRQRKQALKTKMDYVKEAQIAFNSYVRARDSDKACISCGSPLSSGSVGGAFDCGHWRSVGSAPHLRFHEDNAHGQCKKCNRYDSGRAVDYRIGLIARIGLSRVNDLEVNNTSAHYTIEELIAIRDKYRKLARDLKKEK